MNAHIFSFKSSIIRPYFIIIYFINQVVLVNIPSWYFNSIFFIVIWLSPENILLAWESDEWQTDKLEHTYILIKTMNLRIIKYYFHTIFFLQMAYWQHENNFQFHIAPFVVGWMHICILHLRKNLHTSSHPYLKTWVIISTQHTVSASQSCRKIPNTWKIRVFLLF